MDAAGIDTSRPCVRYAWERLRQSGEADAVRTRHFACFLELARRAEPELTQGGAASLARPSPAGT